MTSPTPSTTGNTLREELEGIDLYAVHNYDGWMLSDDDIDAILDVVIHALPKEENIQDRDEDSRYMSYGKGFNDALASVTSLLEEAKKQ